MCFQISEFDLLAYQRKEETDFMTDPANLLSRLRADRAGAIEARRYLLAPHLIAADTAPWTRLANPEDGGAAPGDPSDLEAASDEIAGRATGAEGARGAAQRYDAKGFDEDEITLLRSIRAKADRVEERLESFQAWMAETRSWIDKVETAHMAHSDLGRIVLQSQLRIDRQTKAAEQRAAEIIAEAREQARQLLTAAETVAAEIISADARVVSDSADPEVARAASVSAAAKASTHAANSAAGEVSIEDAEDLYEVIELITRTNAELVCELSALIGANPRRGSR
jgi:vacuolar-type H+-ATPase subunit H